jgi:Tol biopolymer transport system component
MSLATGTRLAHYEILALLGAGGMGEVYRARDTKLQRDVALKVLPPDTAADPERRQRFEREARAVAALNHPSIVTIHSVDDVDGRLFLTMELVDGQPLSELIRPGGLPLDQLLAIATPLADAVSAAHARGITHRDLKPANVMVTPTRQVKVLDFGLAKLLDASLVTDTMATEAPEVITGQGKILGTIAYMAPEQAEGKPVDARSDIFSLGVMLYEMATGERPFKGDTSVSTLAAIMRDTPKSVTEVNPAIPKELGRVIRRALSKDPERRQQTGKDLRNELDEIRKDLESGELTASTAQTTAVRAATLPPRRIPWAAVAAGLAVVTAVGVGFMWLRRGPADAAPVVSGAPVGITVSPVTTEDGAELFPSLSPDGKWIVYTRDELGTGQIDILLRAVGGQTAINLTKDSAADDSQAVFSPDGERIAFRSERDGGGLFVMGRTGESVRRLTTEGFNPSWSPDGMSIVYADETTVIAPNTRFSGSALRVVSVATGERRQLSSADGVQPSWSPHGHRIAYWALQAGKAQRDLWTVAATGGEPVRVTDDPAVDWNPVWSPDGRYLYFSSDRSGGFNLWRVEIDEATGRVMGEPIAVPVPSAFIGHLSISADGTSIAMASITQSANVEGFAFDPVTGRVGSRRRVTASSDRTSTVSVSPDGQWLAFAKFQQNNQQDLWVVKRDGTGLRQVTNDGALERVPSWSPDGTRLMFQSSTSGGRFQVWTIATDGGGAIQVTDRPESLIFPIWGPDVTRALVTTFPVSKLLAFDPRLPSAEQRVEELPVFAGGFAPTSWSADGTRVAGFAVGRPGYGIVMYDVASRTYSELASTGGYPAWLPDGRRLLYVKGVNELVLFDTATKKGTVVLSVPGEEFLVPSVAPDGREVYVSIFRRQSDIVLAKLSAGTP